MNFRGPDGLINGDSKLIMGTDLHIRGRPRFSSLPV